MKFRLRMSISALALPEGMDEVSFMTTLQVSLSLYSVLSPSFFWSDSVPKRSPKNLYHANLCFRVSFLVKMALTHLAPQVVWGSVSIITLARSPFSWPEVTIISPVLHQSNCSVFISAEKWGDTRIKMNATTGGISYFERFGVSFIYKDCECRCLLLKALELWKELVNIWRRLITNLRCESWRTSWTAQIVFQLQQLR